MEETVPQISVVICTRNRGASIVQTLESVFANKHPSFEVIVVDQSTNDETKQAIAPYQQGPCFHYICSDTVGTGRSRNIGLHAAQGEWDPTALPLNRTTAGAVSCGCTAPLSLPAGKQRS